jgi:hypothetical protein
MSKSQRKYTKNFVPDDFFDEGTPPRSQKPKIDKRKERRINRALKTKSVYEFLALEEDEV